MTYSTKIAKAGLLGIAALGLGAGAAQAQNLVVDGSLCVGFDCPAAPAFGFDTILMQENNLRLHFDDTSTTASFPSNDWRLYANDSANGGSSYFGVEDATAGRFVFRVFAGARSDALTIDSQGDLGLGTATPALDIDIKTGNTPSLRLQQDGSSGFTPQTWDVAGNEAGFFIRDATNGSTLPFRIIPGASSNALVIDDDDDISIGAGTNPDSALHIQRASGGAADLLKLENNGGSFITISNTSSGRDWFFTHENNPAGRFIINASTNPADGMFLDPDGDMTIGGTLTQNSDKHAKMAIVPVDTAEILDKVAALPVSTWTYKDDTSGARHLGPMAQDFHAAFGLGHTDKGIATLDTSGVALASIKALHDENEAQAALIKELMARLAALEARD